VERETASRDEWHSVFVGREPEAGVVRDALVAEGIAFDVVTRGGYPGPVDIEVLVGFEDAERAGQVAAESRPLPPSGLVESSDDLGWWTLAAAATATSAGVIVRALSSVGIGSTTVSTDGEAVVLCVTRGDLDDAVDLVCKRSDRAKFDVGADALELTARKRQRLLGPASRRRRRAIRRYR